MAIQRYQYETSPRKLEPEYRQIKRNQNKPTAPKRKPVSKAVITRKKDRAKLVVALTVVFASIFAISYRNSQIDESFTKNEELKQSYLAIQKENEQINVDIENSLNLANVEQEAKELLGMQKLSNKQTMYVNLPKKEYIQPATETIVIEKKENIIEKIINKIKDIL